MSEVVWLTIAAMLGFLVLLWPANHLLALLARKRQSTGG